MPPLWRETENLRTCRVYTHNRLGYFQHVWELPDPSVALKQYLTLWHSTMPCFSSSSSRHTLRQHDSLQRSLQRKAKDRQLSSPALYRLLIIVKLFIAFSATALAHLSIALLMTALLCCKPLILFAKLPKPLCMQAMHLLLHN